MNNFVIFKFLRDYATLIIFDRANDCHRRLFKEALLIRLLSFWHLWL